MNQYSGAVDLVASASSGYGCCENGVDPATLAALLIGKMNI